MLKDIFSNFFTHKDFLPPAEDWYGTLFTPFQIIFCFCVALFIGFACVKCAKKGEAFQKKVFCVLWIVAVITEPIIGIYDCTAGKELFLDWKNILPFWPCSIYLFTVPFAIWGKGKVRYSACGYICTLGLLGGAVNFVYPATYLSRYCCVSFAGFRTVFFHGAIIFTAVTMLLSGYHSFKGVKNLKQILLPYIPALIISIPAHIVNTLLDTDYMFFKMESFFFAPIGAATPNWFSALLVYIIYAFIHCAPYLPSYLANREVKKEKVTA